MRINCHTHVHNLASIFTPETIQVLINRLALENLPGFLVQRVADLVLRGIGEAGRFTSAEQLIQDWLGRLTASPDFQGFVDGLSDSERLQFEVVNSDLLGDLGVHALTSVLHLIWERLQGDDHDARRQSLSDLIAFLYIGLQPGIRQVTHHLMDQQDADGGVIALTMDITRGGGDDRVLYLQQLKDTSDQVLSYPGRLFPFVFVNPKRNDHFEIMERALVAQGFVGVKLYPSLGYKVDSQAMRRVYAFCAERGVPIMQHCSRGGYYFDKSQIANSAPHHWRPILAHFPGLKVCFAHFGGAAHLTEDPLPADSWTADILALMDDFEGVYTDISYHDAPMDGGGGEVNYFKHLQATLAHPVRQHRVLFGSDFFLVRLRLREKNFRAYFDERLTAGEMDRIRVINPARYLGLPMGNAAPAWALKNQAHFIADHHAQCEALPAPWALAAIKDAFGDSVTFNVSDFGSRWSRNNMAHVLLFIYVKNNQMAGRQREDARFNTAAGVRVRALNYWNKEHEAPDIFERKCRLVAEQIDITFTHNGADYEPGITEPIAREALTVMLRDGHTRLVDLGLRCDALYHFPQERSTL